MEVFIFSLLFCSKKVLDGDEDDNRHKHTPKAVAIQYIVVNFERRYLFLYVESSKVLLLNDLWVRV